MLRLWYNSCVSTTETLTGSDVTLVCQETTENLTGSDVLLLCVQQNCSSQLHTNQHYSVCAILETPGALGLFLIADRLPQMSLSLLWCTGNHRCPCLYCGTQTTTDVLVSTVVHSDANVDMVSVDKGLCWQATHDCSCCYLCMSSSQSLHLCMTFDLSFHVS